MKKILAKKGYFLAFFIPLIILVVLLISVSIIGKSNLIITSDMQTQYLPLFSYLKNVLIGDNSLFYSFSKGLGGSMFSTLAYYLMSPLNLLVIFFKTVNIKEFFMVLILIKLSLSSLTMFTFLKYHFKEKKDMLLLLFSICYALCMYNAGYYIHIMWLDIVILTPLVLLGIDKIIKEKSSLLYVVTLSMSLILNYYLGYMLCVMSVIYFLYKLILETPKKDQTIKLITSFGISSLLVGLLSAFVLIPNFMGLSNTIKEVGSFLSVPLTYNINLLSFISSFFVGSSGDSNILNPNHFYIYSSIICFILTLLYFFNPKFTKKEKITTFLVFSVFFLSFIFNYVNYMWHGLSIPQFFQGRYSFLFSFFMIYISVQSIYKIKAISNKIFFYIAPIFPICGIFIYLFKSITLINIYISVGLYLIYLILLYLLRDNIKTRNGDLKLLLVLLVIGELFWNFNTTMKKFLLYESREVVGYYNSITTQIKDTKSTGFYRVEKDYQTTNNDPLYFDFYGADSFLSTNNSNIIQFFKKTGILTYTNSVFYLGGNTILDSLLGMKYRLITYSKRDSYNYIDKYRTILGTTNFYGLQSKDVILYENPYALSLGYMVSSKVKDKYESTNPAEYLNGIFTRMNDSKDVLSKLDLKKIKENEYTLKVTNKNNFYLWVDADTLGLSKGEKSYFVMVNGITLDNPNTINLSKLFEVENTYEIGDEVEITFSFVSKDVKIKEVIPYTLDFDQFKKSISILKQSQLTIITNNEDYLKGKINVINENQVLFTSIPYEKGWEVFVDDKKVEVYSLFDSFLGLDLYKGNHTIEFKFTTPGLKLGFIITLISLLVTLIYIKKQKKVLAFFTQKYIKYEEIVNYLIIGGLTTFVSILSYFILTKILDINYIISTIISWILAVLFAYFTNKVFVFKSKNKEILKECIEFFKYRLLSLGFDIIIMFVMVDLFSIDDMTSKLIDQVAIIVINYVFSKLFIFKK